MWKTLAIVIAFALGATASFAQEDRPQAPVQFMTDLVPQSAVGALLFRNVNELKARGDDLAAEFGWGAGFSMIGKMIGTTLHLAELIDDDRPCGAVWFERKFVDGTRSGQHPVAVGVAVKDLDKVAMRLKTTREELEQGTITESKGELGYANRYCQLHGDYVWIVSDKDLFPILKARKPLTELIPVARRAAVLAADIIAAGNAASAESDGGAMFVKQSETWIEKNDDLDPEEKEAVREFFSTFKAVTWALLSARVDRGLAFDFDVIFDPKYHDAIQTVIRRFNPRDVPSTLRGLPDADVLVAHAAHVEGETSLPAMAVLAREMSRTFGPGLKGFDQRKFLSEVQQLELLGLFGEVWGRIRAYRMAMYRNATPDVHGMASLVAVLDSDDATQLLFEMRDLAGLVDGTGLPLTPPGEALPPITEQVIRDLVRKLGDRSYTVRQSATTRLTLIGEPALSMVEAARQSRSLEVKRRAQRIAGRIRLKIKQAREEALKPGIIREAKPTFVLHSSAEQRVGHAVHVVEMQTAPGSKFEAQLRVLLGPGWRQIRLVPDGERLVVLLGSDLSLLDRTLKNLDTNAPGLAASHSERIATSTLHPRRGAEFRIGISRLMNLVTPQAPSEETDDKADQAEKTDQAKDAEITGIGLTVQPDFVLLQWRISIADLKRARSWWF
jgi:hypothetical protein